MLSEKINKISHSNISTFLMCPHKWKLYYIDKLESKKETIDSVYGTAMHKTIQEYLKYYYKVTLKQIAEQKYKLINTYSDILIKELLIAEKQAMKVDPTLVINYNQIQKYLEFGIDLLKEFIPNINKWFPKQNTQLYGIELELNQPIPFINDILFHGFIDIILYNTKEDTYKIIDLKTSMMGWKDKDKKDEVKRLQLLLYKYFFASHMKINIEKIEIQFIILKKIIFECQYKISRIQKFVPPNAKITLNKAISNLEQTLKDMENLVISKQEGEMITKKCDWCPYKKRLDLCNRNRKLKK